MPFNYAASLQPDMEDTFDDVLLCSEMVPSSYGKRIHTLRM